MDTVRARAHSHGYDILDSLTPENDLFRVRCQYCGRISVERCEDMGWECSCHANPKRTTKATSTRLLRESDSECLSWWDHERNSEESLATATERARRVVAWRCPVCGLHFEAPVYTMSEKPRCPGCAARVHYLWDIQWDLAKHTPVATVPELMMRWVDDRDPRLVMLASGELCRFRCENGHLPLVTPSSFLSGGCPICRGQASRSANTKKRQAAMARNSHIEGLTLPPELVEQWHPTKNGLLQPSDVPPTSRRMVWWRDPNCGHEWQDSPAERDKRPRFRCPVCRTILDSLAYNYPTLASEWSAKNPMTPWQVRPSGALLFVPEWVCSTDSTHRWAAPTALRIHGSDCPMCRDSGKSRIELAYFSALRDQLLGEAFSGLVMRDPAFSRRSSWVPDVTVVLNDGRTLLVEYDGGYWHADKAEVDLAKSLDLLAAGALVVRLREAPLPSLGLLDPHYLELTVYSGLAETDRIVAAIRDWCNP